MISKELLSIVLGYEVETVKSIMDSKLYFNNIEHGDYINIYELAHKCKEWALENGFWLQTYIDGRAYLTITKQTIEYSKDIEFKEISEHEAIFKACQWILDNKDKQ